MCSEEKPEQCHRTLLVGATLTELDIPLAHIDENGEVLAQTAVLARLHQNGNGTPLPPPPPPPLPFDDFWLPDENYIPYDSDYDDTLPDPTYFNLPTSQSPVSSLQSPQEALQTIFGYEDFRPLQAEIINNILAQRDTLVVMPTGGGKSLCYQIPALLMDGLTVVVSPLISLMQDQVSQLQAVGVAAVFLNSSLTYSAQAVIIQQVRQGLIKLLYVAPETLLKPDTIALLEQSNLALLAIDEAHCISQWG
ncbi:MAG: DEAD/DEAH box helicase, partial [Ardenticatenaceae bacterium]|nr:DEAD/DEAH box helicase [Ardenticatenaceae bacterium]